MGFGKRIKLVRDAHEETQQQLADFLGVGQSTLAKWESKDITTPDGFEKIIEKLVEKFHGSASWYAFGTEEPPPKIKLTPTSTSSGNTSLTDLPHAGHSAENFNDDVSADRRPINHNPQELRQDLEVIGTAECGPGSGDFELNGQIVDRVRRPESLNGIDGVFGIYVRGDSMVPRWDPGDLVIVHPGRPYTQGCDVLVELHNSADRDHAGPALLKTFVSESSDRVVLQQYNPPKKLTIDRRKVKHIYRVLRAKDLFGSR